MAKTTQLAMMVRRTVYLEISMNQKIPPDSEKLYKLGVSQIVVTHECCGFFSGGVKPDPLNFFQGVK